MGKHLGDFAPGSVIDFKFNTKQATTSEPFTLAGTPSLAAYKDNSATQDTDGLTLTVDFDSVTGMHHVRVDTTADATFYSTNSCFGVVIAAGTVDGVSAVGTEIASFTIGKANVARVGPDAITAASFADDTGFNVVRSGTAQAGSTTEITLDAGASAVDDFYKNDFVFIPSGAGAGQMRLIAGYVGATKVATFANALEVAVDNTSTFVIQPFDLVAGGGGGLTAADVWSFGSRTLTAGTNIVLAKGTGITGFNDISAANVNAEVLDVLTVDTFAEPTGTPAATTTLAGKLGRLYQEQRNRKTVDKNTGKMTIYDDADNPLWSKTLTDNGTLYNETEAGAP